MQARITIHLPRIIDNYQLLRSRYGGREVAAVVKADGYGLGAAPIAHALLQAGCSKFFVATIEEGIQLREALMDWPSPLPSPKGRGGAIGVFSGPFAGEEAGFRAHQLTPVMNHPAQLERWMKSGGGDYLLHVDTGMTRLGFTTSELRAIGDKKPQLISEKPRYVMSHLACASEPEHAKNAEQLARFGEAAAKFPGVPTSFCNSAGIFLGPEFHGDLARPGCALYGITPNAGKPNPMAHVADIEAPIIMIRTLDRDETVGYGATKAMPKGSRVALLQIGYADGFMRALGNKLAAYLGATPCPILGRVSMDMVAVDVSHLPESALAPGDWLALCSEHQPVDVLAEAAGTIGYELFTRIGNRVSREYQH